MKKFSKLVALALACVMALTMLTACGASAKPAPSNPENAALLKAVQVTAEKYGRSVPKENAELDKIAQEMLAANEAYYYNSDKDTWQKAFDVAYKAVSQLTIDGAKVTCDSVSHGIKIPENNDFGKYSAFATRDCDYMGIASGTVNGHFTYVIVCVKKR